MKKNDYLKLAILPLLMLLGSCGKFVDVQPPAGTLLAADIFTSPNLATAAISTMYINLLGYPTYEGTISLGLYADELEDATGGSTQQPYVASMIPVFDDRNNSFWAAYYANIYFANSALEGLAKSTALSKDLMTIRHLVFANNFSILVQAIAV